MQGVKVIVYESFFNIGQNLEELGSKFKNALKALIFGKKLPKLSLLMSHQTKKQWCSSEK